MKRLAFALLMVAAGCAKPAPPAVPVEPSPCSPPAARLLADAAPRHQADVGAALAGAYLGLGGSENFAGRIRRPAPSKVWRAEVVRFAAALGYCAEVDESGLRISKDGWVEVYQIESGDDIVVPPPFVGAGDSLAGLGI